MEQDPLSREETRKLEDALRRIMEFGYGDGHARGFTCADMAADALGLPRKKRRG